MKVKGRKSGYTQYFYDVFFSDLLIYFFAVFIVVIVIIVVVTAFPLFGASKDLIRDSQRR